MNVKFVLAVFFTGAILWSCSGNRKGEDLSKAEREHIRKLGLLDDDERIVLFASQAHFETSGNFFSDKRIASYWIDERDTTKSRIDFARYTEIDTLLTKDLSGSLTYASFLKVVTHDGRTFKVYVDGNRAEIKSFFDRAISEWKIRSNR